MENSLLERDPMKILIVEGPDGVGKSSYIGKIIQNLHKDDISIEVQHNTGKQRNTETYFEYRIKNWIDAHYKTESPLLIMDRSFFGELVWPDIYKRNAKLNMTDIKIFLENIVSYLKNSYKRDLEISVDIMLPENNEAFNNIIQNLKKRNENIESDIFRKIIEKYEELCQNLLEFKTDSGIIKNISVLLVDSEYYIKRKEI